MSSSVSDQEVAVVGGGPAGLMAAEALTQAGARVALYERMPSLGRKFLLAGRGGLNLTHSEPLPAFLERYRPPEPQLTAAITAFPPEALRAFAERLGEPTFVGSSGRVFPRSFKTTPLLRAWLRRLDAQGLRVRVRHRWMGWDEDGALLFKDATGEAVLVRPCATVLALGGGSWPRLGSDGSWQAILSAAGVPVNRLRPANCGFDVAWSAPFRERFEGAALKRVALRFNKGISRAEAVITGRGLEGGGIYALSAALRDAIDQHGEATIEIDLRPDMSTETLAKLLAAPHRKQSLSNILRKSAKLPPVAIALLQEVAHNDALRLTELNETVLAGRIKGLKLQLIGASPMERAISTAGGVHFTALDRNFMLLRRPGVFIAGEMLDWEAPTGGYLLQACFATGAAAARGALAWRAGRT
jgi:uncharacterized flavoprotein (TIGR03862 family)